MKKTTEIKAGEAVRLVADDGKGETFGVVSTAHEAGAMIATKHGVRFRKWPAVRRVLDRTAFEPEPAPKPKAPAGDPSRPRAGSVVWISTISGPRLGRIVEGYDEVALVAESGEDGYSTVPWGAIQEAKF